MKHSRLNTIVALIFGFAMLAAGLLVLGGCGSQSLPQSALDAHASYNVVMSGLTQARHAGLISDNTKAQIEKVRSPAYDAILALDAAALNDDQSGGSSALAQFRQFLPALQKFLIQFQRPPPAPLK
jgi:hypothetical protein